MPRALHLPSTPTKVLHATTWAHNRSAKVRIYMDRQAPGTTLSWTNFRITMRHHVTTFAKLSLGPTLLGSYMYTLRNCCTISSPLLTETLCLMPISMSCSALCLPAGMPFQYSADQIDGAAQIGSKPPHCTASKRLLGPQQQRVCALTSWQSVSRLSTPPCLAHAHALCACHAPKPACDCLERCSLCMYSSLCTCVPVY